MTEAISPILQWLNIHPHLSGLVTFIISAAESVAIVGTIVPGTVMMTAIGTLAGAGVIPLWPTIIWAILGAIVGDGISYWLGYHFRDRLRRIWPFSRSPNLLQSAETFFYKYGSMSVVIGRFVGPVRALVPLVAGMLGMQPMRFLIANIISAIGWAPIYMLPGLLLGAASLELPPDIAVHAILMLLLTGLFIILCCWLIYKLITLVSQQIQHYLMRQWQNLQRSKYFHIITILLKHHEPQKAPNQLALVFYLITASLFFSYLAAYILLHPAASISVNNAFFHLFRSMRTPFLDNIMVYITLLGDKKVLAPFILVIVGWLARRRHFHTVIHALGLVLITGGGIVFFKHFVHSLRPWGILHNATSYSFPSGHTTFSTVTYFAISLLIVHVSKIKRGWPVYMIASILILFISISRLYLGAHWFTDILGGWLLACIILLLLSLSYNRKAENRIALKRFILLILFSLFTISSSAYFLTAKQAKVNASQLDWPLKKMAIENWWQQTGSDLPLYRVGRLGLSNEIFNLQWVGDIKQIKQYLINQGWQAPEEPDWIDILHRLTDVKSAEHLPLVSPQYLDKKPVLVLIKHINGNKKLMVLRLWDSNIVMEEMNKPLWVGSVRPAPRTYSWLFNRKSNDTTLLPDLIFSRPTTGYTLKQTTVNAKPKIKHHRTSQQILLLMPNKPKLVD